MRARRGRKSISSKPETFSSFFEKVGDVTWRIRGSGVSGSPIDCARVARVVESLRSLGLNVREGGFAGMCAADMYTLEAKFLDGELSAETGNYFGGTKGAWVEGKEAVRLLAGLLGLNLSPRVASKHGLTLEPDLDTLRRLAVAPSANAAPSES